MEEAQERHMDHELYMAAQTRGATIPIPTGVNYHSQTLVVGNNAFHVAAMYGNHEFIALAQLRQYHRQLVCQKNFKGETPLHLAAQFGHDMTVEALVRIHDEVNTGPWEPCWRQRDVNGDTPLHKALRNGHEYIAKLLIDKDGRLISANNTAGESLAYLAAESFCNNFLNHILESPPIHQNFVSFSAPRGQTVFHSARRLTVELMRKLITIKSELLNTQDEDKKTVVHYAVEEDRRHMVEELLKKDRSFAYLRDKNGLTPLDIAFKKGLFQMVKIIMETSPQSIELHDKEGKSALHHVKMDAAFLEELRTKEAELLNVLINQVDDEGNTPLHIALKKSEQDAALELVRFSGCNWRLKNNKGESPLDLCKSNDNISVEVRRLNDNISVEVRRLNPITKC